MAFRQEKPLIFEFHSPNFQNQRMKNLILVSVISMVTIALQAQFSAGSGELINSLDNPLYVGKGGTAYMPLLFQKSYCYNDKNQVDTLMTRIDTYSHCIEIFDRALKRVFLSKDKYVKAVIDFPDDGLRVFRCGFKDIDHQNSTSWYELLYDGKVKLLKHTQSKFVDCYEYGGIYKQCISQKEKYYLLTTTKDLVGLDNDKDVVWKYLGDKSADIKKYAAQQRWKTKKWKDFIEILKYSDSI